LIIIFLAVISYIAGSGINKFWGICFAVLNLSLLSLNDVRANMQNLVIEVPELLQIFRNFFKKPALRPIKQMIEFWYLNLFRPIDIYITSFSPSQQVWYKRAIRDLIFYSALFFFNLSFVTLTVSFLGAENPFRNFLPNFIVYIQIYYLASISIVQFQNNGKPLSSTQTIGVVPSPELLWFFILVPWVYPIVILSKSDLDLMVNIVALLIGLSLGASIGAGNVVNKPKTISTLIGGASAITIVAAIFLITINPVYIGANSYSQPIPIYELPENSPMIEGLASYYDQFFLANLKSEPVNTDTVIKPNAPSSSYKIYFYLSISTFVFISSILGIWIGNSLLLLLLEAPFFYLACLLLIFKQPTRGLFLFSRTVLFDQWRRYHWLGTNLCYSYLMKHFPEEFLNIIMPQLFITSRHELMLNLLVHYMDKTDSKKVAPILVNLLPFIEFSGTSSWNSLSEVLLVDVNNEKLINIRMKKRSIFKDLANLIKKFSLLRNELIIQGFKDIVNLHGSDQNEIGHYAESISISLSRLSRDSNVRGIVSFSGVIENSLRVTSFEGIGSVNNDWVNFIEMSNSSVLQPLLKDFAILFQNFSQAARFFNDNGQKELSEAALQSLFLRIKLEKIDIDTHFGIIPVRQVAKHWEELLINYIKHKYVTEMKD